MGYHHRRLAGVDTWFGWALLVVASVAVVTSEAAAPPTNSKPAVSVGDAMRGKAVYDAKCSACHSIDDNRVGPLHKGVLGRKAGSARDYEYSDALQKSKVVWTRALLDKWLTDPESVIPGQKMGYRLEIQQNRQDVVQYLSTLK